MHFRKKSSQYQSFIWRTWKILILNLKSVGLERYFSTVKVRVALFKIGCFPVHKMLQLRRIYLVCEAECKLYEMHP